MNYFKIKKNIFAIGLGVLAALYVEGSFAKDKVVYEKSTKIDFEAAPVDGQFLSPDGAAVKGDKNLEFDSLIDAKANFKKELRRDAGAVR